MSDLLLIRHGLCDAVGRTLVGRSEGIHLNAIGVRQAGCLADRLEVLPITAVYSSPMERARETAAPLAGRLDLPVRTAAGLNELDFGTWTGRTIDSLRGDPVWDHFNTQRGSTRIPGGESMDGVVARACGARAGYYASLVEWQRRGFLDQPPGPEGRAA